VSKSLKGSNLKDVKVFGQHFYTGCIEVQSKGGKWYRLSVEQLLPLLKQLEFDVEKKKVHSYLSIKEYW